MKFEARMADCIYLKSGARLISAESEVDSRSLAQRTARLKSENIREERNLFFKIFSVTQFDVVNSLNPIQSFP